MTIASSRPVECQKCRRPNQVEICESITSHDRNLRDKLMSGALWKWRCTHCAHENVTIYPLLYHDMRTWCLMYYLDRDITQDPNVIARMVPAPDQLTALRRFNATYRFRLCRSLGDFIEKMRIIDAGLDDRAVEYLKDKAFSRAANARFERLMDGETKILDFETSPSPSRASRTEIAFTAYADALVKIKERLGDETDPNSGFVIVDQSYIEKRFAEAAPKIKDARAPREASPADMGSVVFGKSKRYDEARKSWWRFW
jgi:hypothetical protein